MGPRLRSYQQRLGTPPAPLRMPTRGELERRDEQRAFKRRVVLVCGTVLAAAAWWTLATICWGGQ